MIQGCDKFQHETQNLAKSTNFEKFIFTQQWLTQNMWYIGETIYVFSNKLQRTSFKNSFIQKNEKRLKLSHNYFVK
jgi:hypothetical protein